jgi:hypothetical protein
VSDASPRPYPEARPPHLPDVVARQSPWLLLFGAITAVQVWRLVQNWDAASSGVDAGLAVNYLLSWIPAFAPPLIGVALFSRHPDARRTMPLLVFGILLLSLGELLSALDAPIRDILRNLTPPDDQGFGFDTPGEFAFRVFTLLLTIFGLLYVGAGLSTARSRPRARTERPLTVWLAALAFVAAVLSIADLTRLGADLTPNLILQIVIAVILGAVVTFAWAYLAAVTVGGWMAGEAPRRAWAVGGIAVLALFGLRTVFPVVSLLVFDPSTTGVLWVLGYASYAAWLGLIAAFFLGLPTPPDPPVAGASSPASDDATGDPPAATQPGSAAD